MKKDKEWLKEELSKQIDILHTTISSGNYVSLVKRAEIMNLIDQLEEPQQEINAAHDLLQDNTTLSQEDFDLYWNCINDGVAVSELKQEKVVIPQFVADRIEEYREIRFGLSLIFTIDDQTEDDIDFSKWLSADSENCEKVARAWLDGYTVEKQKLYRIKISKYDYLVQDEDGTVFTMDTNLHEYEDRFTEQEIKAIDERYWAFAEEVPQ